MTTLDTIVVDKNAVNSAMNSISINDKAKIDTLVVVSVSINSSSSGSSNSSSNSSNSSNIGIGSSGNSIREYE